MKKKLDSANIDGEQFILFETAKLAKEKGYGGYFDKCYDPECNELNHLFKYWDERSCSTENRIKRLLNAPTQSLIQRWLRETHGIDVWVEHYIPSERYYYQCPQLNDLTNKLDHWGDTYEEALEKGLQEALKLIK